MVHTRWFPVAVIAVIICLVLAVFTGAAKKDSIISRTLGGVLLPAERGITHAAVGVADTYNKFHGYDALKAENDSLKKQVTDLTKQLESAQADVKENKELKSMLGVSERNTSFSYEQAQVIGRTLEKHDCVVTSQGMVGYISDLSDHTAQVTTIIDKNMSAGALVTRTGEIGVAAGDYKLMSDGKLKVSYLSKDADVVVGDSVTTSGTGGYFPKGLTIGTVESIKTESDGMSNYAVIAPMIKLSELTNVYIITETETTNAD